MTSKTAATTKAAGTGNAPQKPGAPGDSYAPLDSAHFREAMSRIVTAVHILTTDGAAGRLGATVSAVCSVTDDPCSILVCVNRASRVHAAILKNRVFCVNTLQPNHQPLSDAFAGRGNLDMDDRFAMAEWTPLATGCPGLKDASLSIDCEVFSVSEMGTHSVIIGTVADVRMSDEDHSLVYIRRGYHSVSK
ncbi:flavin reductase [uncultured Roseibium sp.]|uniref:flavin reductase n=1 Tax=uncultured Roseibium sp. TaxID=1936171 RepID=UPI003216B0E2